MYLLARLLVDDVVRWRITSQRGNLSTDCGKSAMTVSNEMGLLSSIHAIDEEVHDWNFPWLINGYHHEDQRFSVLNFTNAYVNIAMELVSPKILKVNILCILKTVSLPLSAVWLDTASVLQRTLLFSSCCMIHKMCFGASSLTQAERHRLDISSHVDVYSTNDNKTYSNNKYIQWYICTVCCEYLQY